jgi:hypothetical protein
MDHKLDRPVAGEVKPFEFSKLLPLFFLHVTLLALPMGGATLGAWWGGRPSCQRGNLRPLLLPYLRLLC